MKTFLYLAFFGCCLLPIYTYLIYPLLLSLFPKKKYEIDSEYCPTVSVLIAAYNEEKIIKEKIINLEKLNYPNKKIEVLIASDGSTDKTVETAKKYISKQNIKIIELPRGGKVTALNILLEQATGEILVFSDANTLYDSEAIKHLVKHFSNDKIGCVSGQLRYSVNRYSGGGAKSENFYWKYENWVKEKESAIGCLSGANGAIYAVKGNIVKKFKPGVINDDFYMSTRIQEKGYDVIFEKKAIAYEKPNNDYEEQFKRHVRDGSGHYQALIIFWKMLFSRKGSFVYISHRVIKWIVPFAIILIFITNLLLIQTSLTMKALFILQSLFYLFILCFHFKMKGKNSNNIFLKLVSICYYFLSVNLALITGFFKLIFKKQGSKWETSR